jgi:uncharacterized protein (TIGR02246 family)
MSARLAIFVLVSLLLSAPRASAQGQADQDAIRAGVRDYVAAFNKADTAALTQLLHPDFDQTNRLGLQLAGRDNFVNALQAFRDAAHRPTLSAEVTSVKFLTPDIAVARGSWTGVQNGRTQRGLWMSVVQKRDGRWTSVSSMEMEPVAAR